MADTRRNGIMTSLQILAKSIVRQQLSIHHDPKGTYLLNQHRNYDEELFDLRDHLRYYLWYRLPFVYMMIVLILSVVVNRILDKQVSCSAYATDTN